MKPADLAAVDEVRHVAGWNQTLEDWRRFLRLEPEGCFVCRASERIVGSVTALRYGDVGWIGMLLVHPEFRGRGRGRSLLEAGLAYLKEQGVRCVKLDATPAGRELYEKLGFRSQWGLGRWRGLPAARPSAAARVRALRAADEAALVRLETAAFGAPRGALLRDLVRTSEAAVAYPASGPLRGFGLLRRGARALYVGPVAARAPQAGRHAVMGLLARARGAEVVWDIPDDNTVALEVARAEGFHRERRLTRMCFGEDAAAGDPRRQFAIADPALG